MICKTELEYIVIVLNDYISGLPASSKIAVGERVQHCIMTIEKALQPPLVKEDTLE